MKLKKGFVMRNFCMWIAIGSALVVGGCGRQQPETESTRQDSAELQEFQPEGTPSRARGPEGEGVRVLEVESPEDIYVSPPPFRLSALLDRGDGRYLAGLVVRGEDVQRVVRVGDEMRGYRVVDIDGERERVTVSRSGRSFVLHMEASSEPVRESVSEMNDLAPDINIDRSIRTQFEPTRDEIERGIDPNDPSTWPAGYRGPGIERAGLAPIQFEPLDFEIEQGIDPNDPSSWPTGYRGPGIERALRGM